MPSAFGTTPAAAGGGIEVLTHDADTDVEQNARRLPPVNAASSVSRRNWSNGASATTAWRTSTALALPFRRDPGDDHRARLAASPRMQRAEVGEGGDHALGQRGLPLAVEGAHDELALDSGIRVDRRRTQAADETVASRALRRFQSFAQKPRRERQADAVLGSGDSARRHSAHCSTGSVLPCGGVDSSQSRRRPPAVGPDPANRRACAPAARGPLSSAPQHDIARAARISRQRGQHDRAVRECQAEWRGRRRASPRGSTAEVEGTTASPAGLAPRPSVQPIPRDQFPLRPPRARAWRWASSRWRTMPRRLRTGRSGCLHPSV